MNTFERLDKYFKVCGDSIKVEFLDGNIENSTCLDFIGIDTTLIEKYTSRFGEDRYAVYKFTDIDDINEFKYYRFDGYSASYDGTYCTSITEVKPTTKTVYE